MINTNIGITNTIKSAPDTVQAQRSYTSKKDYEATIESALAYTKDVLNRYKNCYVPDRLVKKFGKKEITEYVAKLFPDMKVSIRSCGAEGGYVIDTERKKK